MTTIDIAALRVATQTSQFTRIVITGIVKKMKTLSRLIVLVMIRFLLGHF